MDNLTTQQIADFNNPLAFARGRTDRVGQTSLADTVNSRPLRTDDIEESFRLVTGALSRLETLQGNLTTMLGLAESARSARGNERKLQEIYGKLRSLSAGFDQVVEAIQFKGRPVFSGQDTFLSLGPGTRPVSLDAAKLMTYGEDSLGLSQAAPTASASIQYRTEDLILNEAYDIIGLDIEEATYREGSNPALELESGDYKVAVSYAGPDSTVELRTLEGTLIERRESVDLSGNGREWVDFEAGLRLSFSKENFFTSFDKYDYETNGPAELSATLAYERLEAHILPTGESPPPDSVSFPFNPSLRLGEGVLSVESPRLSAVDTGKQPLESGFYNLEIEYRGEQSILRLTDSLGRLKAFDYNLDLASGETTEIDLGVGLSVTVRNEAFATEGATLSVPVNYNRQQPPLEEFDFREYARQIEEAIGVVSEQITVFNEARTQIEETNRLRTTASTSGIPSALAFNATGALSLLSGGGSNSFFKPLSSTARFNTLSTQLFSTTTALPTQANQTPEQLASLQNTASTNAWLGNFA